jgi:imidazolonepropionase-like amidohydrolase
MYKFLTFAVLSGLSFIAQAQNPAPALPQSGAVIILNATAHLGDGTVIANSVVAFDKGKITLVADASAGIPDTSSYKMVIHAAGKHVYPGLINCNTTLGLTEIDLVRSTRDFAEVGDLNPNVRSAISYNTDSKIIPTLRSNGILLSEVVPQGGTISGQSSVMQLDAWNWEDAIYKENNGIHLNWPSMYISKNNENEGEDKQRERISSNLAKLESYFQEAKAYASEGHDEKNLRFEAMRGLFDGTRKLYVHAYYVKAIESSAAFCKRMGIQMVLVGGTDAWLVTSLLKKNHIPVVLVKTHNLPPREDSDVDQAYKMPFLLHRDSVEFAISFDGTWNTRNLPFDAGTAVTYGLTKEEALMSITSSPAKILGIDNVTGTLTVGKDANIILSTGDILDIRTNNVEMAFIQGRNTVLDDVQKQLYRKYQAKYKLN